MYRRIAMLASLAAVAAMCAGSLTATAAPGDAATCVFEGAAGELVDEENGPAGIPSALHDFSTDGELHDFEHGSYAYEGPATCAGKFGNLVLVPSVNNATIASYGEYDNVVCGTGWVIDADGSDTEVFIPELQPDPAFPVVSGVGYESPFVAGAGPLHIGTGEESTDPEHDGPITGGWIGSGAVDIEFRGNCVTTSVNQFDISGSFAITSP